MFVVTPARPLAHLTLIGLPTESVPAATFAVPETVQFRVVPPDDLQAAEDAAEDAATKVPTDRTPAISTRQIEMWGFRAFDTVPLPSPGPSNDARSLPAMPCDINPYSSRQCPGTATFLDNRHTNCPRGAWGSAVLGSAGRPTGPRISSEYRVGP